MIILEIVGSALALLLLTFFYIRAIALDDYYQEKLKEHKERIAKKTCGECAHFHDTERCPFVDYNLPNDEACENYDDKV